MTIQDDKIKKDEKAEKHGEDHECECDHESEELKHKVEQLDNSYKRALADYQNLQKRTADERLHWLKVANGELLLRLLPVLDTLMLAYQHTKSEEMKVGINMFIDTLKTEGVSRIETKDKMFDPQLMEAIEVAEGEDGKVLAERRAGFMIHDKLLRPAQVTVGKKA